MFKMISQEAKSGDAGESGDSWNKDWTLREPGLTVSHRPESGLLRGLGSTPRVPPKVDSEMNWGRRSYANAS